MDAEGLKELFEPFGAVTVRRMFGGHGVYRRRPVLRDRHWTARSISRRDAENEAAFAAAGSAPFIYMARGKPMKMAYWRLVADAYDDARRAEALGGAGAWRRRGGRRPGQSAKEAPRPPSGRHAEHDDGPRWTRPRRRARSARFLRKPRRARALAADAAGKDYDPDDVRADRHSPPGGDRAGRPWFCCSARKAGRLGTGGGGGFMTGRGQANALSRATAILGALFFASALLMSIIAGWSRAPRSIIDDNGPGGQVFHREAAGGRTCSTSSRGGQSGARRPRRPAPPKRTPGGDVAAASPSRSFSRSGGSCCSRCCRSACVAATEAGVVDPPKGSDAGAPAAPDLGMKALATTIVAAVVLRRALRLRRLRGLSVPSFRNARRVGHSAGTDVRSGRRQRQISRVRAALRRHEDAARGTTPNGVEVMMADMAVGYKAIRESFTTRITLDREKMKILVEYVDGPFSHLATSGNSLPEARAAARSSSSSTTNSVAAARRADGLDVRRRVPHLRRRLRGAGEQGLRQGRTPRWLG